MEKTLPENLCEEVFKLLKQRKTRIAEYICNGGISHEEYLTHVGYIRAIKEVEDDFSQLYKTFFPEHQR